ncbi:porin, partial [Burkholderia gladioli]
MPDESVARASFGARRLALPLLAARQLALAALCGGAAAPAFAQGSVTLYGVIDTSIELTNPASGWVPRLDSGAYRGSRIGLRGAEP